jgi:CarD family transcriptional regulator
MFDKGEFIVYGRNGVCLVEDIKPMSMDAAEPERLYYVLHPVNTHGSTIFTPVDNTKVLMRKLLSKEEAVSLIDQIPEIDVLKIPNEKTCEEQYKAAMQTGKCSDMVKLLKTIYQKNQKRLAAGKRITSVDEKYFHMVQDNLYTELSILIDVPKDKVEEYITAKLEA